ncbi:hybrid sensor histidine kinase/response regulator [Paenibacillus cymbidii]|uniref:hybrid sensor histidine kinase/response regulator n=1 Tax=Paenibacillus cymbidii TaxID=1639034 RepID=UPI001080C32F|nr:ATP-binding protein [Paenibacillus cymbidii]
MKRSFALLIACMLVIAFVQLAYYGNISNKSKTGDNPQARQGVIDLTGWDETSGRALNLDGQWELYWGRLLMPGAMSDLTGYYKVPKRWTGELNGRQLTGKGVATYRLALKTKPTDRVFALRIGYIHMSSTIYINGVRVGGSGLPGLTRAAYEPLNIPYKVYFQMPNGTADIVIQVANFDNTFGGIGQHILFGTAEAVDQAASHMGGMELATVVALLMLGIYHIGAYMGRRNERGFLYFGLYCLFAGLALSTFGNKLFMQMFPGLPFELLYKLQGTIVHVSMLLLLLFMQEMCSGLLPRLFTRSMFAIYGAFIVFVLLVPFRYFNAWSYLILPLQMVAYAFMIVTLVLAFRRGAYGSFNRRGMFMLILGMYCLLVTMMDSGMFLVGWVPRVDLTVWSTWAYSVLISLLLAFRYSEAYTKVETISRKLIDVDKLKDEFLANTSHEFQTPLNGIINMSQFMLEGGAGEVGERQRHHLSIMLATSRKLSSLVRDILDMEKIKRGEIELAPAEVDVRVTISVVLEVVQFLTAGKNVRIVSLVDPGLPHAVADENRLRQILFNLIGNAIKFTDRGTVTVAAEETDETVKLIVEDTGIGIERSKWEAIFELYGQENRQFAQEFGGTGIGLSISRRLARLMGGRLEVEWSEIGFGTRMSLHVPKGTTRGSSQTELLREWAGGDPGDVDQPDPPERTARRESAAASYESPRIAPSTLLAVDDEPANLLILRNIFERDGVRVVTASNGEDAVALLQKRSDIDLVLLDVMMPRLSGYEACRRIRRQYSLFELPVVMLTVRSSSEELAAGFQAGANDFIVKPFDAREVRARVATLLRLKASVKHALQAELAFLQSQIKPHFLYNALNAILSFCLVDGARAAELITHLSSFLRRSFDVFQTQANVSLTAELELVKAYAAIEQARFEERLTIVYDIDESLLHANLPPVTIQPLVENAIRHGIMQREEGGTVTLTIRRAGADMLVQVEDNGVGMPEYKRRSLLREEALQEALQEGRRRSIGLANIHRRLRHLYGDGLRIESVERSGTTVSFLISELKAKSSEGVTKQR